MANLGFIGLGIMGKPLACHLIAAGHTVHVYSRSRGPVEELCSEGAAGYGCCREVARESDIIFIMLPDTPDVEAVLF